MGKIGKEIAASLQFASHNAGTFSSDVLERIEDLLPGQINASAETGCGKSTILFSRLADRHTVFCLDDRSAGDGSSVNFYTRSTVTRHSAIREVWGPTQKTLPAFTEHDCYDCVLIDGPHGYPFPELEYYYFYSHIRTGGLLVLDDVHIPTIGRMADFLQEDEMFSLVEIASTTAIFIRTSAPVFDPTGDGWWTQKFNQRRAPSSHEFYLNDERKRKLISTAFSDPEPKSKLEIQLPALDASTPDGRRMLRKTLKSACHGMSIASKAALFWPIIRSK